MIFHILLRGETVDSPYVVSVGGFVDDIDAPWGPPLGAIGMEVSRFFVMGGSPVFVKFPK